MGQTTFQWTFQVLKGLTKQVILGSDFLGRNKALIDFREATLRVGKHVFQMEGRDKTASECYLLKTLGRVELKPQASTLFPCKVSSQVPSGSYLVRMIDTAEGFCDQPGIAIANAVVQVTDSTQVNILAVNETGGRQVIPRHAVIATLESVPESDIDSITVVPDLDRVADAQPQAVDLDVENAQQLSDLIDRYPDVFANSDLDLGSTDLVECNINTGDTAPIKQRPYRTPFLQRSVVEDHLTKLLAANIIRPSVSPWASPIVIVGKKDKTTRMCIDFRKVNACSVPNCYPLPQIDDILASLGGAKYFSKMDLKSGYHQIPMSEESRPKTAFITHMGLFEYNRMPFGLAGAPPIFQDLMNNVLQGLLYESVLAYLDDVIVYSKTIEDHLIHVEQVFLRFRKAGLKLKLSKCEFFMKQLQFLGHVISERGIQPDFDKVKVICEMPPLCCVRDVRAFIGMCGYYRRYIPNFAHIAAPLIALTRKNARFDWTGECEKAFAMLKSKLTEAPILIHPVHDRPYRLYTDASDYAVGAILAQLDENGEERVVHYLSQQLNHTQRKWAVIEKEAWALVVALKKFRQYLLGAQFVVYTDHKPLRSLFTSEMKNARIQRWGILISEFNCEIKYREGKSMKADFVSRIRGPTITGDGMSEPPSGIGSGAQAGEGSSEAVDNGATSHLCSFNAGNASGGSPLGDPNEGMKELGCDLPTDLNTLKKLQQSDPELQEIYEQVAAGVLTDKSADFVLEEGILYHIAYPVKRDNTYHLQLVVPRLLTQGVLYMMHDNHGHMGLDKTHDLIRQRYFWQNSYRDVHGHINKCLICAQRKLKALRVPIQSMPVPDAPFQLVAMDLQGPFPETENGDRYILSLICMFSGWPEAFSVPDKSADTVARVLLEEFISRHSCPETLLSDLGTEFCNDVINILSRKMGIVRAKTTPYHPQTNGKVERLHRVINDIIAKRVAENQLDWHKHLPAALFAIRTSVHTSSRFSPYFLVHGREPKLRIDTLLQPKFKYMGEDYVPTMIQRLHHAFVEVKANLRESQLKNQEIGGVGDGLPKFQVGDKVFYANLQNEPGLSRKLKRHWQPYFRMFEQTSPVNYLITHLPTGTVKRVHASHLRQVPCDVDWDKQFSEPADIVSAREQSRLTQAGSVQYQPGQSNAGMTVGNPLPVRRQPIRACRLSIPVTPMGGTNYGKRKLSGGKEEIAAKRAAPIYSPVRSDPVKRVRGFGEVDGEGRQEVKRRRIQVIENSPETPPKENGKAGLVYSFLSFLGWRSWECYW